MKERIKSLLTRDVISILYDIKYFIYYDKYCRFLYV